MSMAGSGIMSLSRWTEKSPFKYGDSKEKQVAVLGATLSKFPQFLVKSITQWPYTAAFG